MSKPLESFPPARFELFSVLISSISKSLLQLKKQYMGQYDLSSSHTNCICRLLDSGNTGLTQKELSELEKLDRSQVSRVLAQLIKRGYIYPMEPGEYKQRYRLTPKGIETGQKLTLYISNINRFVSGEISDEDLAVLYRTLETISENLKLSIDSPITKEQQP